MTQKTTLDEGICQAVFTALALIAAVVCYALLRPCIAVLPALILALALGAAVIWGGVETLCSGALQAHGPARPLPGGPLSDAPAAKPPATEPTVSPEAVAPVAPGQGGRVALAQAAADPDAGPDSGPDADATRAGTGTDAGTDPGRAG